MWVDEYTLEPLLCSESPSTVPCLPVSVVASTLGHTPSKKASFSTVCFLFYQLLFSLCPEGWPGQCLLTERLMEATLRDTAGRQGSQALRWQR